MEQLVLHDAPANRMLCRQILHMNVAPQQPFMISRVLAAPSSNGQIFDSPFNGYLQLLGRFIQRSPQFGLTFVDAGL